MFLRQLHAAHHGEWATLLKTESALSHQNTSQVYRQHDTVMGCSLNFLLKWVLRMKVLVNSDTISGENKLLGGPKFSNKNPCHLPSQRQLELMFQNLKCQATPKTEEFGRFELENGCFPAQHAWSWVVTWFSLRFCWHGKVWFGNKTWHPTGGPHKDGRQHFQPPIVRPQYSRNVHCLSRIKISISSHNVFWICRNRPNPHSDITWAFDAIMVQWRQGPPPMTIFISHDVLHMLLQFTTVLGPLLIQWQWIN